MPERAGQGDGRPRPVIELPPPRNRADRKRNLTPNESAAASGHQSIPPSLPEPPPIDVVPSFGQSASVPAAPPPPLPKSLEPELPEQTGRNLPADYDTSRRDFLLAVAIFVIVLGVLPLVVFFNTVPQDSISETSTAQTPALVEPRATPRPIRTIGAETPLASTPTTDRIRTPHPAYAAPTTPKDKKKAAAEKLALGQAALENRYFSWAEENFQEAALLDPNSPAAQEGLGWARLKLERLYEARENFAKATKLNRSSASAWKGLVYLGIYANDAPETYRALTALEKLDRRAADEARRTIHHNFGQKLALLEYPALGVIDSPFNSDFRKRYNYYQVRNPDYFTTGDWPVRMARETARALAAAESPQAKRKPTR